MGVKNCYTRVPKLRFLNVTTKHFPESVVCLMCYYLPNQYVSLN